MCGIAGFIDFTKKSNKEHVDAMIETLYHRGPDGGDSMTIENENYTAGLGHRRLAIIDVSSAANQPMQFENLWITFNGEIYNFQEIKKELIQLGHSFKTISDTEVILHDFSTWGVNFVNKTFFLLLER